MNFMMSSRCVILALCFIACSVIGPVLVVVGCNDKICARGSIVDANVTNIEITEQIPCKRGPSLTCTYIIDGQLSTSLGPCRERWVRYLQTTANEVLAEFEVSTSHQVIRYNSDDSVALCQSDVNTYMLMPYFGVVICTLIVPFCACCTGMWVIELDLQKHIFRYQHKKLLNCDRGGENEQS